MTDTILTERRDRVLIITMNRPEAKNAINGCMPLSTWNGVS